MQSIIEALREIVGEPNFYKQLPNYNGSTSYSWDYNAMFEYFFACVVLCVVISWIFKFLKDVFIR